MAGETKVCESCDAVIGQEEKTCPKCGIDFEETEEIVSSVERANAILAKRKAKETPVPPPEPAPITKPKGAAKLRALGKVFKK